MVGIKNRPNHEPQPPHQSTWCLLYRLRRRGGWEFDSEMCAFNNKEMLTGITTGFSLCKAWTKYCAPAALFAGHLWRTKAVFAANGATRAARQRRLWGGLSGAFSGSSFWTFVTSAPKQAIIDTTSKINVHYRMECIGLLTYHRVLERAQADNWMEWQSLHAQTATSLSPQPCAILHEKCTMIISPQKDQYGIQYEYTMDLNGYKMNWRLTVS